MNARWPTVMLGEILRRSEEVIQLVSDIEYREITVRLWGKGVIERRRLLGAEISGDRRFVARSGQFIVSRIDARNGAMGLIPTDLDGAIVTNDFPLFDFDKTKIQPEFLGWFCQTRDFIELCQRASEGTTNRVRLQEGRFLALEISLPPLTEQGRIVARIEELAAQINEARSLRREAENHIHALLLAAFKSIAAGAPRMPLGDVAPLVRRSVEVDPFGFYPELGIRSFGKGTFHKPALPGLHVGEKRLFQIEPGDLLFNNVFAWEGAIAVVKEEDKGRFGSHRFITCLAKPHLATSHFLCFYFLTRQGLEQIGEASPGGAGRNRTLGLDALSRIEVPAPPIEKQKWFDGLLEQVETLRRVEADSAAELDALVPSILDKAFKGDL